MSDFVNRLVSLRGMRSKAAFARDLGIAPQVYQRYEDGRIPSPEILARIADRCKVTVDHLLGRVSPSALASERESAPPAPSPRLLREPRAEYSAISPRSLESRVAFLETQCAAIVPQLNEIRRLLVSLLAEGHSRDSSPVAGKERVG